MRGSLKIARIAGIGIYIHWTFALLIGYVLALHLGAGETLQVAFKGLLLVIMVFCCVLLHELGHALAARRFGILTRDITMLPIGGVARLERIPREPRQELIVAAAGPAVNVVIATLLAAALKMTYGAIPLDYVEDVHGNLWAQLMVANVFIVVFNLVPAFPMDGGRILRALLAMRIEYARATKIAARLGQALAVVFGLLALYNQHLVLVFIAIFVFLGAQAESQMVQTTSSGSC